MGKIEAIRHNVRDILGIRGRHRIAPIRIEDMRATAYRLTGVLTRALLVMILVIMPSVILPGITADTKQMVALVALFAGVLTFVEYRSVYPGLIEFRDAPPFNRIRFLMLFAMIFFLSIVCAGKENPTTFSRLLEALGILFGSAMDFPYSPVRLATLMMADGASPEQIATVRLAAGSTYLISLISLAFFVVVLKLVGWPSRNQAFNVWINLPTFDPTSGGDVVERLERDARVNLALGFLLPFLVPAMVKIAAAGFEPLALTSPQTLIWTMAAWAFLPASLFMRGIAMARIAEMIRAKRRINGGKPAGDFAVSPSL